MEINEQNSLKGQLLIAMPELPDPNFAQTVTCICEHTRQGTVGIVINRVHHVLTLDDIFKELKIEYLSSKKNIPFHIGGPVNLGEIFVLHSPPFDWHSCLKVTPSIALSNGKDIVEAIANGTGPESFIIATGCAGWGPGQLESEIKKNAWLTCPLEDDIIFNMSIEYRWEETLKKMGVDPLLLSTTAGHA